MTYYSGDDGPKIRDKGYAELATAPDDLYRTNIQTAEINALNAALAVTRFKQIRGFYLEELPYHHAVFYTHDLKLIGEWENP